jgi:hypothetical protein
MTKQTKSGRRYKTVMAGVGVAIGAMALTGVGIAAFSINGNGDASGKTLGAGDLKDLAISAVLAPNADLLPGGPAGAAQFTVTNANGFPVKITAIDFGTLKVTPAAGKTCAASNFTVAGRVTLTTPITVAANATSQPESVPGVFKLLSTADNGCQGATLNVTVDSVSAETAVG